MTTFKSPPNTVRVITVTEAKNQIRAGADFSATSATGGVLKKAYWTPDGRKEILIPQMHQITWKDDKGNVTRTAMVDLNLEKGYLSSPPSEAERKPFCKYCGWHDTQAEVDACKIASEKLEAQREALARQELANEGLQKDKEIEELKKQLAELTKLVKERLK